MLDPCNSTFRCVPKSKVQKQTFIRKLNFDIYRYIDFTKFNHPNDANLNRGKIRIGWKLLSISSVNCAIKQSGDCTPNDFKGYNSGHEGPAVQLNDSMLVHFTPAGEKFGETLARGRRITYQW